jgi:hypothetical protein
MLCHHRRRSPRILDTAYCGGWRPQSDAGELMVGKAGDGRQHFRCRPISGSSPACSAERVLKKSKRGNVPCCETCCSRAAVAAIVAPVVMTTDAMAGSSTSHETEGRNLTGNRKGFTLRRQAFGMHIDKCISILARIALLVGIR